MKRLLPSLFILILSALAFSNQNAVVTSEKSSLALLEYKWSKVRYPAERIESFSTQPAKLESQGTRNYERNRVNEPLGARDPYLDTVDGRSAAIEKNVQEARTRVRKAVDAYDYRIKVQNGSTQPADIVFWEYQFVDPANPALPTRRQFLCSIKIDPGKAKEIQAVSLSGPSEVVTLAGLSSDSAKPVQENAVINRVEYVDGKIWQRKDWKFAEIKLSYTRAVTTPWGKEMCRGL